MNPLFIFLICFIPLCTAAQVVDTTIVGREIDSLFHQVESSHRKGDFKQMFDLAVLTSKKTEEAFGGESCRMGTCLNYMGWAKIKLGSLNEAEVHLLEAKRIFEKWSGTESMDFARCLNHLGNLYLAKGNYVEAESLFREVKAIRAKLIGTSSPGYAEALHNLALLYQNLNDITQAEPLYLEEKIIYENLRDTQNLGYAWCLNNLGNLYKAQSKFAKAEPLFLSQKAIRAKLLGTVSRGYCQAIHNLAWLYQDFGDLEKAEPLYLEEKAIWENLNDTENPDYAWCVNNLGNLYSTQGRFAEAEPLFIKQKIIRAKLLGTNSEGYAQAIHNLALLYQNIGNIEKAEPLYLEEKTFWEQSKDSLSLGYTWCFNNLGNLYMQKGEYAKAKQMHDESIRINARAPDSIKTDYLGSLNPLANSYFEVGDFDKAEQVYLKALELEKEILGRFSLDYANSLTSLGFLYGIRGDFIRSEHMHREASEIFAKIRGKQSLEYANALKNIAYLHYVQGDYSKAEPLYIEAVQTLSATKDFNSYAFALENLAELYVVKEDFVKAERLFLNAEEIKAKLFGKEHPFYAIALMGHAELCYKKGNYVQAELMYSKAKDIREKVYGSKHRLYGESLYPLAILYNKTNRISESVTTFLEINEINRKHIEAAVAHSSESQMLAYLRTFDAKLSQFQSLNQTSLNAELSGASFDNALFLNSMLRENTRRLTQSIAEADSITREAFKHWQGCRRRLAREYAKPIAERSGIPEMEAEAEGYEKSLTRNLSLFNTSRSSPRWQDIQSALPPSSAAIEFIHYKYYTPEITDSTMYAALVLRPGDSVPQFIPLFEKNELKELMRGASGGGNFVKINALYSQKSLYDLLWKPLEPLLTGIKTVYYAPSGLLHRLNLAAIPTPEGLVYGERRQLVVLGSTRSLAVGTKASQLVVPDTPNKTSTHDAYLAGGIRYDSDSTAIAYANRGTSSRSIEPGDLTFQPDSLSISRAGVLNYLPYTATEIQEIGRTLRSASLETKVDTGFYATEESFRQLGVGSPSPRIVHLATHGYFFPDPAISNTRQSALGSERDPVFKISDHPMIRSGLILAGAKQAWLTGKHPEGQEDGILTAYEISQMNLSGTELVVLSACETGLGDIVGNEGVYGLQRAFKIAGARYLIMSLWKVDDQSTQAFMTSFYQHWLTEKQTIPEAFRTTQREMRAKYSGAYDWAGFVLIE